MTGQNQEFCVAMLNLKCLLGVYVGCWKQKLGREVCSSGISVVECNSQPQSWVGLSKDSM